MTTYVPDKQASIAAPSGYPDSQAKPRTFTSDDRLYMPCPVGAIVGLDASQNEFASAKLCGREWCPNCGRVDGWTHKRRMHRWWDKATQIDSMLYAVLTVPPALRWMLRDPWAMSDLSRRSTRLFQRLGFDRGLRAWHLFGDPPPDWEDHPVPMTFHPHLNVLVDGGYLEQSDLARLKRGWRRIVLETQKAYLARLRVFDGVDGLANTYDHYPRPFKASDINVNVQYSSEPGLMAHWLKYVVRPTFWDAGWDTQLASAFIGFRGRQVWGGSKRWEGESVWATPEIAEELGIESVSLSIAKSLSPLDESEITWQAGLLPMDYVTTGRGWVELDAGYFVRAYTGPPPPSGGAPETPWWDRAVLDRRVEQAYETASRTFEKYQRYGMIDAYECPRCHRQVLLSAEAAKNGRLYYVDMEMGRPHRETCGRPM